MSKTPAQVALDDLLRKGLVPRLKGDGFRMTGRTFRRTVGRGIQVVNVQVSRWSGATALKFTLNLGVFFPEVHAVVAEGVHWTLSPAGPAESQCQIRVRIGQLMPAALDHWWHLDLKANPPLQPAEVDQAFASYGAPWLASTADFDTARERARAMGGPGAAVAFALAAGDRRGARSLLRQALTERPEATAFEDWAKKLGFMNGDGDWQYD